MYLDFKPGETKSFLWDKFPFHPLVMPITGLRDFQSIDPNGNCFTQLTQHTNNNYLKCTYFTTPDVFKQ